MADKHCAGLEAWILRTVAVVEHYILSNDVQNGLFPDPANHVLENDVIYDDMSRKKKEKKKEKGNGSQAE